MARVLIVDDDPVIRSLVAGTLRNLLHCDVEAFADAESALTRLAGDPAFDLLVFDFMLPDKDGPSLCKDARKHSAAPIVILSAEESAAAPEATVVLRKPFKPAALAGALRPLLRVKAPEQTFNPEQIKREFLRSLPEDADRIERGGDARGIAHRLKGSAGTFGVTDVADAAAAVDRAFKAGDEPRELVRVLVAVLRARGAKA